MRDRFGRRDEVGEAYPLVGCWPFLVDADVARTVLHGRDTEHFLDDVAVTDVDDSRPPRGHKSPIVPHSQLGISRRGRHLRCQ